MPNGPLTGYKRRGRRRRGDLAWRGRSAAEPISELLSLLVRSLFSAPSLTCAGFEEALAVSRNAPSASCSSSDLFPCSVRRSEQRSASVRRPVRYS